MLAEQAVERNRVWANSLLEGWLRYLRGGGRSIPSWASRTLEIHHSAQHFGQFLPFRSGRSRRAPLASNLRTRVLRRTCSVFRPGVTFDRGWPFQPVTQVLDVPMARGRTRDVHHIIGRGYGPSDRALRASSSHSGGVHKPCATPLLSPLAAVPRGFANFRGTFSRALSRPPRPPDDCVILIPSTRSYRNT